MKKFAKGRQTQILICTFLLALLISAAILLPYGTITKVIISAFVIAAPLVIMHPGWYLSLFLILRSSLDLLAKQKIFGEMNIAAISTVALILLTLSILMKKDVIAQIRQNRFLMQANKLFALFLLVSLFSFMNTQSFLLSSADYLRMVSVIVLFNYAFLFFSGKDNFKKLFLLIILSAMLPLLVGGYQYLFHAGIQETPGLNRIYGTFLHPNVFAQYLVIIFLAALYFISAYKHRLSGKTALLCFLALVAFELYHTYSRGSWIALSLCFILFSLSFKMSKKIVLYFLLGIVLIFLFAAIQDRFWDVFHAQPYKTSSCQWRGAAWNSTIAEIKKHPIIGSGLGMYEQNFTFAAHNDYLRFTYETGILGLVFYLLFLFYLLFRSLKANFVAQSVDNQKRYIMAVCLIAALLIMSLASNMVRSTVVLIYLFCILGGLLG